MAWLHQFLNRNTCQDQATSIPPETAPSSKSSSPTASMMQVVAEETIMAVAQWLINLVNRQIQAKPDPPVDSSPGPEAPPTKMEDLLSQFGRLIEQSYEREQRLIPLETRLGRIESALINQGELAPQLQKLAQLIDHLNQRLVRVEDLAGRVNINEFDLLTETTEHLTQQVDQSNSAIALLDIRILQLESGIKQNDYLSEKINQINQTIAVLAHRVGYVEKVLARFNPVSNFFEEDSQNIIDYETTSGKVISNSNGVPRKASKD